MLSDEEISTHSTRRLFQRRTSISEVAEPLQFVYVLRSGVVSVARSLSGGRRQVLDFLMGGASVGLNRETMADTSIRVLEDAEACQFPAELFEPRSRSTGFIRGLIRLIEQQIDRIHSHIVLLGKFSAEERVVAFLLRYRESRLRLQPLQSRVDLPMTRRDIADHLGMAPETVSRVLSWLQERQLILHIPDGIRILDLDTLSQVQLRGLTPPRDENQAGASRAKARHSQVSALAEAD